MLKEVKFTICKLQKDIMLYYNWKQTSSSSLSINSINIHITFLLVKLLHQYLRFYIGSMAYYLKLLSILQRLYPVFNIIKLITIPEDLIPSKCLNLSLDFILINRQENILNSYWYWERYQYLVKWKSFGLKENFWKNSLDIFILLELQTLDASFFI